MRADELEQRINHLRPVSGEWPDGAESLPDFIRAIHEPGLAVLSRPGS